MLMEFLRYRLYHSYVAVGHSVGALEKVVGARFGGTWVIAIWQAPTVVGGVRDVIAVRVRWILNRINYSNKVGLQYSIISGQILN